MFAISALTGDGVPELLAAVSEVLTDRTSEAVLTMGFDEGRKRAWLFDQAVVRSETQTDDGYEIAVRWTPKQKARFERL